MRFDYLLYDNRTRGASGRDWGLKVATGALADNRRVRGLFVDYCRRSFDTRVSGLRDFDTALGGFPVSSGAYLLCVTLETRDWHGRPACGFVGILCPGRERLRSLLADADPLATARAVYESETPPADLEPRGRPFHHPEEGPTSARMARDDAGSSFARFERGQSPRTAAAILWRRARPKGELPSILGIATWTSRARRDSADRISFYQNLPAELAARETVDLLADEVKPTSPAWRRRRLRALPIRDALLALALLAVLALGIASLTGFPEHSRPQTPDPPLRVAEPTPVSEAAVPPAPLPVSGDEDFLERIELVVARIGELSVADLHSSPIYGILVDVDVRPEHGADRAAMVSLLDDKLPALQRSVLDTANLDYYFAGGRGSRLDPATRVSKVREHLDKLDLGAVPGNCRSLRQAFGLMMSDPASSPAAWCEVVEELARARDG